MRGVPQHLPPPRQQVGVERLPREETSGTCRQFTCKYHGWRYDLDGSLTFVQQEGEFFDLDKSRLRPRPRALRRLGGLHLRQPRREARAVAARVPRADDHLARGLPVRQDDRALALPLRGEGELEALHGRLPGVLPRTGSAREAVAGEVLQRRAGGRVRGAALPDRRSAPPGEHGGHPGVGARSRHAQADRGDHPQRAVRPVGRARPRPRSPRA